MISKDHFNWLWTEHVKVLKVREEELLARINALDEMYVCWPKQWRITAHRKMVKYEDELDEIRFQLLNLDKLSMVANGVRK